MSRALVVVFAIAAVFAGVTNGGVLLPRKGELDGRIVGGEDAEIVDFPWQLSVQRLNQHICGGVIISTSYVLTAGHCLSLLVLPTVYSVKYGVTLLSETGSTIKVVSVIRHEHYNPLTIDNDIAILGLAKKIVYFSGAQPIAIISNVPVAGTEVVVTGWGTTSEGGSTSDNLQKVTVTVTDHTECANQYGWENPVTANMLCAGEPEGGKDSCQGDSGGPLVSSGQLAGLVSWGIGCGRPGYPGVYTNVANYKKWIEDRI